MLTFIERHGDAVPVGCRSCGGHSCGEDPVADLPRTAWDAVQIDEVSMSVNDNTQTNAAAVIATHEERQFDFWLGEWNVTWGDHGKGTNNVRAILDDHVILENFDGTPTMPLRGMSVSTYDRSLGQWQQTWVDNQGSYLDFVGGFKDGEMVLRREARIGGAVVLQRMVWYNISPDEMDWNWERSDDRGGTWSVLWKIHYVRASRPSND
jgi:hypothetical protein